MKIVIAPDSFKESMTAAEVCAAVEAGFKKVFGDIEYRHAPVGDGGEGTVQSVVDATDGEIVNVTATGPLGEKVDAFYGITGDGQTAVIEMAAASGLHLVPREQRNPLVTTTYGTGELILDALDKKVERIVIGLGGSATNDGGAGMAAALGAKFLDVNGEELRPGGESLSELLTIDVSGLDPRLKSVKVDVASDVTNPLTGPLGASAVFGPQKGATPEMVGVLDASLKRYAEVIERNLGLQVDELPGAGAAGGLGSGVVAFLDGNLQSGIDLVLDVIQFEETVRDADLVITGEGRIDSQTVHGKAPVGVAKRAKAVSPEVPVITIAGSIGPDYEAVFEHGIDAVFSVVNGVVTLEEALANGAVNVEKTAENIARTLNLKVK
ncbi:glycerate kinase [Fictibacillus phosphorivorans]|uniref:glycerate kinase n=1 Tax=Fictibacillus phosphorivorans TaxID=1221500 RepID=UPI00203CF36C|nr:glycerate kinase [Fictibacillus phosphorivorans]MCM3717810.1 glycerate kinase [Fictibacillus phosphorivorans]MCM3777038.1 glycerate kinase [Fictibacillus phosphorivorans]